MARFKKGESGNPEGRKKGVSNKLTAALRQKINSFLSDQWPALEKEFQKLPIKEKFAFYEKLLQFALPRLESISLGEVGYEDLSEHELDLLLKKLRNETTG